MGTLYLHIGRPKTGTTAIQHFLSANRKELRRAGYLYPRWGHKGGAHRRLAFALMDSHQKSPRNKWMKFLVPLIQSLESNLWEGDVVVSSESFTFATEEDVQRIRKALGGRHEVKVICYLRRQDQMFQSAFNQRLKKQWRHPSVEHAMAELDSFRLDYREALAPWVAAFRLENVIIRIYEKQRLPNGVIPDFLGILGITDFGSFAFSGQPQNPALGRRQLDFLMMAGNSRVPKWTQFVKITGKIFEKDGSEVRNAPSLLSPQQCTDILAHFKESNSWVARNYLGKDDGRLFSEPVSEAPTEATPPPSPEQFAKATAAVWTILHQGLRTYKTQYRLSLVVCATLAGGLLFQMLRGGG